LGNKFKNIYISFKLIEKMVYVELKVFGMENWEEIVYLKKDILELYIKHRIELIYANIRIIVF
jgi:hypothetical protein